MPPTGRGRAPQPAAPGKGLPLLRPLPCLGLPAERFAPGRAAAACACTAHVAARGRCGEVELPLGGCCAPCYPLESSLMRPPPLPLPILRIPYS